jgi:gentisate 1,2-dioxygenase
MDSIPLNPFDSDLRAASLAPLWKVLSGLVPAEPRPSAVPHLWRWQDVRRPLLQAGELISAEAAERRVLVLENPGLPGSSQITDTLYAGMQLILPGETAPAHRHTQSAFRMVLEEGGGYTAVDGERIRMRRGDLILTPHWTWHDHGHDGDRPTIWLDGLDVPLVSFLKAGFREEGQTSSQNLVRPVGYSRARFGGGLLPLEAVAGATSRLWAYSFAQAREALEASKQDGRLDPHAGIMMRYINPANGGWAMPTLATTMRLLPRGFSGRPYRSTDSTVLVILEGTPLLETDALGVVQLGPNDVFAVPGWTRWRMVNQDAEAIVFSYSDRPVHEKLGLLREDLE